MHKCKNRPVWPTAASLIRGDISLSGIHFLRFAKGRLVPFDILKLCSPDAVTRFSSILICIQWHGIVRLHPTSLHICIYVWNWIKKKECVNIFAKKIRKFSNECASKMYQYHFTLSSLSLIFIINRKLLFLSRNYESRRCAKIRESNPHLNHH